MNLSDINLISHEKFLGLLESGDYDQKVCGTSLITVLNVDDGKFLFVDNGSESIIQISI